MDLSYNIRAIKLFKLTFISISGKCVFLNVHILPEHYDKLIHTLETLATST